MFQPLDSLFGIYCRTENAAGIVINVKVQPSMQRFTAAHELGHHVFDHEPRLDEEGVIRRYAGLDEKELEAQYFAAEFLMPVAAVNKLASGLNIDSDSISPLDVYQMSLRLGTSYSATVTRLQTLGWIAPNRADEFLQARPQDIKQTIADGVLEDRRSDIWLVSQAGTQVRAQVGDYLQLMLPEIPSTGYRWQLDASPAFQISNDVFTSASGQMVIGGSGTRLIGITAIDSFEGHIRCVLKRAWLPGEHKDEFELPVEFRHRATPGVYPKQLPALAVA